MSTGTEPLGPVEAGTRTLQGAVHRRHAVVESLRRLLCRPAENVAKNQHCALFRRQQLERGNECELNRLALLVARVRPRLGLREVVEQAIGVRLEVPEPCFPRALPRQRERQLLSPLQQRQANVRGDSVQPRGERRARLEAAEVPPRAEQRLLACVVGVVQGAEHPVAVDMQHPAVGLDEERECGLIALASGCQ